MPRINPAGHTDGQLLPRLSCRCPRRRRALHRLRLAAGRPPSRTCPARHRPCRLRRLLCGDREARQPLAARPAPDRRRRPSRRRRHRLLHRPHLRGAIGDADVRGAAAVSPCGGGAPGHGEIWPRRPRGARHDARPHPAGGAVIDRRSVSRSRRHRAPARHAAGKGAGAVRPQGRAGDRHHRLDRAPTTSSSPKSPPISTSRVAFRCSAPARRRRFSHPSR
jgi:hypothetical protein